MRSWLLVAADDETALSRAAVSGADVVVVDLDRAIPDYQRDDLRIAVRDWVHQHRHQVLHGRKFARWVRIAPLSSTDWREDLLTVLEAAPEGVLLPEAESPAQVQQLAAEFYEIEQRAGLAHGAVKIVPMVSCSARSALAVHRFADEPHPRLGGLAWDAPSLAADIDLPEMRDEAGRWFTPFEHCRASIILAARAHGLEALETALPESTPSDAFEALAKAARRDGFTGMFARNDEQLSAINAAAEPDTKPRRAGVDLAPFEPGEELEADASEEAEGASFADDGTKPSPQPVDLLGHDRPAKKLRKVPLGSGFDPPDA